MPREEWNATLAVVARRCEVARNAEALVEMMDRDDDVDSVTSSVFARLEVVGGDVRRLDVPAQTVAIVVSAEGVIGNGGLRYFFENDWPGQPPYSLFSDAYRRIGALREAESIDQAAALFPFPEPEKETRLRNEFMNAGGEERLRAVTRWGCDVRVQLAQYVRDHRQEFELE